MRSAIVRGLFIAGAPGRILLGVSLVCVQAGCGGGSGAPDTYPVSGVITYKGAPVAGANVAFRAMEGQPATGVTNEAGEFTLTTFETGDGAVAGDYKVTVSIAQEITDPTDESAYAEPTGEEDSPIPLVYSSMASTLLDATVTEDGDNTFTFELEDQ